MSLDDSSESLCASFQIMNENNHKVKDSNIGVSNALADLRRFLIPAVIRKIGKPRKRYSHHLQLGDGWRLASFVYVLCRWYFWSLRAIIREEKNPFVKGKKEKKNRCQFSSLRARLWLTVYGTSVVEIITVSCRTGAVFDCRKHTGGLWHDLKTIRHKAALKSLQIAPQMLCVCVGVCMGVGGVWLYVVTASLWHWAHC